MQEHDIGIVSVHALSKVYETLSNDCDQPLTMTHVMSVFAQSEYGQTLLSFMDNRDQLLDAMDLGDYTAGCEMIVRCELTKAAEAQ